MATDMETTGTTWDTRKTQSTWRKPLLGQVTSKNNKREIETRWKLEQDGNWNKMEIGTRWKLKQEGNWSKTTKERKWHIRGLGYKHEGKRASRRTRSWANRQEGKRTGKQVGGGTIRNKFTNSRTEGGNKKTSKTIEGLNSIIEFRRPGRKLRRRHWCDRSINDALGYDPRHL